jgi:mRNA-degrading endonuclease toxin of MazEF toxin-antitoxin module
MNKRITREDIVACNWSWASVNEAKAYRNALIFLRDARTETPAITSIKNMMRWHATEAIRQARLFTVSN